MNDNLNWSSFKEQYNLKDDRYVRDVALLQRLQDEAHYPIIIYPQILRKQIKKTFMIGSAGVLLKDQSHIYIHDFLNVAKSLGLKGDDWQFLTPPFNPKNARIPKIQNVETEAYETYKTYNYWGCLIPTIGAMLFAIPAFFMDLELGIVVFIMWLFFFLLVTYRHGLLVCKPESKIRKRKRSPEEIRQLKQDALEKYQKDIKAYQKLKEEYENKEYEFRKRRNSQSALLDKYAELIVPRIFYNCLISCVPIKDCETPPQRGISENDLFYALMKEFPSYVKIDKSLGVYAPDLVLHNGCSCPIDIEIDEPYEYKTKKEIHYIGCGDEERNEYFSSNNWFVLRFTENQIKNHLLECMCIIKSLIHFIEYGDTSKLNEIERIIVQIQEPRWSKEKSRMLAIENYRAQHIEKLL